MMQFLVTAAMLLVVASFVYPPLGRKIRNFGRWAEDQRNSGWGLLKAPPPPPPPPLIRPPASSYEPTSSPDAEKAVFGKRVTIEEPRRPTHERPAQIFSKEIFEGRAGDLLREVGFAPDDPGNQTANNEPLSVLLAEDQAHMRRVLEAGNAACKGFEIVAWHLLPPTLWHGKFGPWLRQALDLSPYRPWNTIFLPNNATGAEAFGLPIAPPQADKATEEMTAMLEIIFETYAGKNPPEAGGVRIMLDGARSKYPQLFPNETADFSDRVRQARSDVRVLAFSLAVVGGAIDKDAIARSQQMFLGDPDRQLVA